MKKLFLLIACLFLSLPSFAASGPVKFQVNLLTIKAVNTGERGGDELYLDVTKFSVDGDHKHIRIPEHPMYWPSEHLEKVNNLSVWKGELVNGQSIELVFSLVEHDIPPWNVDDLIGTVRLKLMNDNGDLVSNWSMPNRATSSVSINTKHGKAERFTLTEDDHVYDIYFQLKEM